MTGRRYERKLVNLLDEHGWAVMKSPSSGSGTDRDQPDLLVGHSGVGLEPLAIEAKSTRKDAYTVRVSEADQLADFARDFGARPIIAMYWKGPPGGNTSYGGWWFRPLEEVRRSPAENDGGRHHLRPRREDREKWVQAGDITSGVLLPEEQHD